MGKYFPTKAQEFLELKQGAMTVIEYVATDAAKVRRFENVMKLSIRGRIVGLRL